MKGFCQICEYNNNCKVLFYSKHILDTPDWNPMHCSRFTPKGTKRIQVDDFYKKFCAKPKEKVSITEFICKDYYLGKYTSGGERIWGFCKNHLASIFDSSDSPTDIIFHAGPGTGKTTMTFIGLAYQMYSFAYEYIKDIYDGNAQKLIDKKIPSIVLCGINKSHSKLYKDNFISFLQNIPFFNDNQFIWNDKEGKPLIEIIVASKDTDYTNYNVVGLGSHISNNNDDTYTDSYRIYCDIAEKSTEDTKIPIKRFCTIENHINLLDICPSGGSKYYKPYFIHAASWEANTNIFKNSRTFTICVIRRPHESHIVDESYIQYSDYEYIRVPDEFYEYAKLDIDSFLRSQCDIFIPYPDMLKNLAFNQALEEMKKGKKIKRVGKHSYFSIKHGYIFNSEDGRRLPITFSEEDILANDWVAFK